MENRERICRFCLKKCDANFKAIRSATLEILNMLQLKMNLAVSDEAVMCTKCSEILKKCSIFKKTCLNIRDRRVAFANDKNNSQAICELCMNLLENSSFVMLDNGEEHISMKIILENFLPELQLSASKKPVICDDCHGSLQNYSRLLTNSSIVEETIKAYCEVVGINNMDLIELNDVLEFTSEKDWKKNYKKIDFIKIEDTDSALRENEVEHRSNNFVKVEKSEQFPFEDVSVSSENDSKIGIITTEEKFFGMKDEDEHTNEDFVKVKDEKFLTCNNGEIEIKTDQNDFDSFQVDGSQGCTSGLTMMKFQCKSCSYQTKHSRNLKRHMLVHKDPSEVMMFHCDVCSFKTKYKRTLNMHIIIHKKPSEITMYHCASCSFQTRYKACLSAHVLVHRDLSELAMYQCEICPFKTKYKKTITNHSLLHDPSKATMFQCESCPFQTRYKLYLKKHMLVHKNPAAITYQCEICSYQTNFKCHMMRHMSKEHPEIKYRRKSCSLNGDKSRLRSLLTRKNYSEIIYRCTYCSYRATDKITLKQHTSTHETSPGTKPYQCNCCPFQTNHRASLQKHKLGHKSASELTMFPCEVCPYQTKDKGRLKKHMLVHSSPSDVTMYLCKSCAYQTKYKHCLETHQLIHKSASELTMYKCEICPYQTKNKWRLKQHMLAHSSPSEVTMYQCQSCSFQTKYNNVLKKHSLTHKDPSDTTMYLCETCAFQTKYKTGLQKHMLTHRDSSEVTLYKCEFCSVQTKHRYYLRKHILKHHPQK